MGEWSLFSEKAKDFDNLMNFIESTKYNKDKDYFIKGGIWKNFLTKYTESNRIHKRCINISKKISLLENKNIKISDTVKDFLYKAQCNDVLWHGIFGGLYLPNLRNNAYKYIIKAEKEIDDIIYENYPIVEKYDYDLNGYDEIFIKNELYNAIFSLKDCGQLISFDIKNLDFNFLNTMSRHKEKYHSDMLETDNENNKNNEISTIHDSKIKLTDKEKELLIFDWYDRNSFIDHFVTEFNPIDFEKMKFTELGDFVNTPAEIRLENDILEFSRTGGIYVDGKYDSVLKKIFTIKEKGFDFEINFQTEFKNNLYYVLEMNFHFYNLDNILINEDKNNIANIPINNNFIIKDNCLNAQIRLGFEKEQKIFSFPVATISQSEKGMDLTNQSLCILLPFRFSNNFNLKGSLQFEII
jgi:hypothetical protein